MIDLKELKQFKKMQKEVKEANNLPSASELSADDFFPLYPSPGETVLKIELKLIHNSGHVSDTNAPDDNATKTELQQKSEMFAIGPLARFKTLNDCSSWVQAWVSSQLANLEHR